MKLNTLEKLYLCLRDERPEIVLPEELRKAAEKPLLRMLERLVRPAARRRRSSSKVQGLRPARRMGTATDVPGGRLSREDTVGAASDAAQRSGGRGLGHLRDGVPARAAASSWRSRTCVVSGLPVARRVFELLDRGSSWEDAAAPGSARRGRDRLASLSGNARPILTAERVALNLLQRMCGIATATRRFVEAVAGTGCRILDTRKTAPGLRAFDRQAVAGRRRLESPIRSLGHGPDQGQPPAAGRRGRAAPSRPRAGARRRHAHRGRGRDRGGAATRRSGGRGRTAS